MNAGEFLIALILVVASVSACASQALTTKEAYIIIDKLLDINSHDEDPKASLDFYREWSELYVEYWKRVTEDNPTEESIKVYLLLVFAAYESFSTDTTEHIAETIASVFEKHSGAVLKALENHHFLVVTTCQAIGESFNNADTRELENKARAEFMNRYKRPITDALNRNNVDKQCFLQIENRR